jgi:hypothetical protein
MLFFGDALHSYVWIDYISLPNCSLIARITEIFTYIQLRLTGVTLYIQSFIMASLLYCTKNKLKKSASSMGFCLTRRLASSCNFNSLILVNLIKCLCSKEISIWLHFIGRIKLRTRINATCVRTLTTCSYNYGLVPYIFDLGVTKIILCLV